MKRTFSSSRQGEMLIVIRDRLEMDMPLLGNSDIVWRNSDHHFLHFSREKTGFILSHDSPSKKEEYETLLDRFSSLTSVYHDHLPSWLHRQLRGIISLQHIRRSYDCLHYRIWIHLNGKLSWKNNSLSIRRNSSPVSSLRSSHEDSQKLSFSSISCIFERRSRARYRKKIEKKSRNFSDLVYHWLFSNVDHEMSSWRHEASRPMSSILRRWNQKSTEISTSPERCSMSMDIHEASLSRYAGRADTVLERILQKIYK